MASQSPPVSRGEPAVVAGPAASASAGARLARRIRLLREFAAGFYALAAAVTVCVLLLIVALVAVIAHGASLSVSRYGPGFLTGTTWDPVSYTYGAAPAIAGTLLTSALALLIAVPIAIGVGIFLSEIAPPWLRRPLALVVDLSAAVPSVVYGFWAFIVLAPVMQHTVEPGLASLSQGGFPFSSVATGTDLLTATLVLAIMVLPTIAAVARESFRAVPRIHRESALSLGATRWEATRLGVLSPARRGMAAGIILGLGRALGETIAVTMVIGNIYILPGTLFSKGATLATQIVNQFPGEPGIDRSAIMELALILFAITLVVNVVARLLLWRAEEGTQDGSPGRRRGLLRRSISRRPVRSVREPLTAPGVSARELPWRKRIVEEAPRRIRRRRWIERIVIGVCAVCVVLAILPFASVIYTAVQYGGSAVVRPSFYTSLPPTAGCSPQPGTACDFGGIGPEIQGTLIMLGLGALIAVPVGLLGGIYLAEYGRNPFARLVSFLADVMTGVPTIILGVFVFSLFVYLNHNVALCALSGGVGLGVLMIPIAIRGTEEALGAVPRELRESALALGFPRHWVTLRVVLGCARGGLVTGMLLAASRAAGDTAVLLLTAGGSSFWFRNLNTPTAAITPFIYNNFGSSFSNLQADAWGAALVLLGLMLAISLGARLAVPESRDLAEVG